MIITLSGGLTEAFAALILNQPEGPGHGGQRRSLLFITDKTVAGGWSSSLWAYGPLLRTLGLDGGDPRIRGSTGAPRIPQVQSVGGCCYKPLAWKNRAAGELPVGSQAPKDRGERVGLRELVLLLLKLTRLWGMAGCLGDTPIPGTLGVKVSFPQC